MHANEVSAIITRYMQYDAVASTQSDCRAAGLIGVPFAEMNQRLTELDLPPIKDPAELNVIMQSGMRGLPYVLDIMLNRAMVDVLGPRHKHVQSDEDYKAALAERGMSGGQARMMALSSVLAQFGQRPN